MDAEGQSKSGGRTFRPIPGQRAAIFAGCLLLLCGIGWLDYLTGESPDVFIFQFLPLALAAWTLGAPVGVTLSVVAALGWLGVDLVVLPGAVWRTETWEMISRLAAFLLLTLGIARLRADYQRQRRLNEDLKTALDEIKQLRGILPMCSFCRRIRDGEGHWVPVEIYIHDHSAARISHGLCPRCYKKHYGEPNGT